MTDDIKSINQPRQAIVVKFLGPTDHDYNPRWQARAVAGRIIVYNDDTLDTYGNAARAAIALCRKLEWDASLLVAGTLPTGEFVYVLADPPSRMPAPHPREARIKCTDKLGNVHYVHYAAGAWRCTSANGIPCALSYAGVPSKRETECLFALNDAKTPAAVLAVVQKFVTGSVSVEPFTEVIP